MSVRLSAALLALAALSGCSRQPLRNYQRCLQLRVGLKREQALKFMGPPDLTEPYVEGKSLPYMKGTTAYEWTTPAEMPAPNRVVVNEATGLVQSIRCGDSQVESTVLPASLASTAAPAAYAPPPAAYAGYYGFSLPLPAGWPARASFIAPDGIAELVLVAPPSCASADGCPSAGGFTLTVLPRWFIAKKTGAASFDDYVDGLARRGAAAAPKSAARFGPWRGWTLLVKKPDGAATFLEGSKAYYVFAYQAGSSTAAAAMAALAETRPRDDPPALSRGASSATSSDGAGGERASGRPIDDGR